MRSKKGVACEQDPESEKEKQKRRQQAYNRFSKERFQRDKNLPLPEFRLQEQDRLRSRSEQLKEEYLRVNLGEQMVNRKINLNDSAIDIDYFPLHYFDDQLYETILLDSPIELLGLEQRFNKRYLVQAGRAHPDDPITETLTLPSGRAIVKLNGYRIVKGTVSDYIPDKGKFQFISQRGVRVLLPRIFICFDIESPASFLRRLEHCLIERMYQASLVKVSHIVESMPNEFVSELGRSTKKNVESLVVQVGRFKSEEISPLWEDVEKLYTRTMNSILFQSYKDSDGVIPVKLHRPQRVPVTVPERGLLPLEGERLGRDQALAELHNVMVEQPKRLEQLFKIFCHKSFYTSTEVITVLTEVRQLIDEFSKNELFLIDSVRDAKDMSQPFRYDYFQTEHSKHINKIILNIKAACTHGIKEIINREFKGAPSGWNNTAEKNKAEYDKGKLKRFFKMINTMIQDALLSLFQKSVRHFLDYVAKFIPVQTKIHSAENVVNYYSDGEVLDSAGAIKGLSSKVALFESDLTRTIDDSGFSYTTPPRNYANIILNNFDRVADSLSVRVVEELCMFEIYKNGDRLVRTPNREKPAPTEAHEIDDNKWLKDAYQQLKDMLMRAIEPAQKYITFLQPYVQVLKMKPEQYYKQMEKQDEADPKDVESLRHEILQLYKKEKELLEKMPHFIQVSFFKIHCKDTVQKLAQKYSDTAKQLENLIAKKAKKLTKALQQKFEAVKKKIMQKPEQIEKLVEIREFMSRTPEDLMKLEKEIQESNHIYEILDGFKVTLSSEEMKRKNAIMIYPKEILLEIEKRQAVLQNQKSDFQVKLEEEQGYFREHLDELARKIAQFHLHTRRQNHREIAENVQKINANLALYVAKARKINSREALFERELTDYSKLQQMQKDFLPYSNLWLTTDRWVTNINVWMNDSFETIDAEECERFIEEAVRNLNQVIRYFREKGIDTILKISEYVKAQVDQFRPKVPLMVALRKKGMSERHWKEISDRVGIDVKPEQNFTFSKILKTGLLSCLDVCQEVGEKASKEYVIEVNLKNMMAQWEDINFKLNPFKTSYIISAFEDIVNVLDEHLANTMTMQFSPFKKHFEEEIITWNNTLRRVSDIIEEWIKLQVNWMYLQPIFDSPDISKQLPGESKKFKSVDVFWKSTMSRAKDLGSVLKVCQIEELFQKLIQNNNSLDIIQKELDNYLEKKRQRFARFFFLSNQELLEILSKTKEPTAVQPHLKKVFQNIVSVEFDEQGGKTIKAMFSAERERVPFTKIVDPKGKNVEDWMTEVQDQMRNAVRHELMSGVEVYSKVERKKWVMQHPGQCVLNGSQVWWTLEVEQAFQKKTVKQYYDKLQSQLNELVELVLMKLNKNERITLNSIIVIDVHAKDVVEGLYKANIEDRTQFEWICNLRYYIEDKECMVKCLQTNFPYGYEYLGNTLRLVITALTDKCYMTLMGALKLNLGGAPAGPAGTGKTETTKDLAKALAKQCVVFNCSDSMDYLTLGKLFKGFASSGAWACFDQFNRINIEVLSVIAQQLLVLFGEKAKGSTRIDFEGSDIRLMSTFSVFITMNPGYAGRTELPDNLKALFRPVAMMVPDYAIIGEIMLYSFGFKKGRELAKKMVTTFKLSSEQLSSQDHYDYGMRAVRSVINAAGLLKEQDSVGLEEQKLLLRALRDVNVPKFLKDDLPLFQNIIKDLFPGLTKPNVDYGSLQSQLVAVCGLPQVRLMATTPFIQKIIQLFDTIQVRHGLMLVGPTGGGKTSNYQVLKTALSRLQKQGYYKVLVDVLNPKSIQMGQLYGNFDERTHEWTDGILARLVREATKDRSPTKHWIMFDGPVDALWIENMNTVLDDNKKLCLNSGQILLLTPQMTMMFEVEDLAVASPATVSRCGMVYMEPVALGLEPLLYRWKESFPPKLRERKSILDRCDFLFKNVVFPSIEFVRRNCKQFIKSTNNNLAQSTMRLMNCYFNSYVQTQIKKVTPEEVDQLESNFDFIFLFCLTWSVGATCDTAGRNKFNQLLFSLNKKHNIKNDLTAGVSVYDRYYNQKHRSNLPWSDLYKNFIINQKLRYHQILIPTTDLTRNGFVLKLLINNNYHTMLPGPTGTGKSANSYMILGSGLGENFQYIAITFSSQTSANQTQDSVDSKLEKRKSKVFGAPVGKKYVIFVDDLNMPKKEEFGAQPPIEILRQFLDHGGWYNRKEGFFIKLEDLIMLTALGPPGGGRSEITGRMVRHFNQISHTELSLQTANQIFSSLVTFFFSRQGEDVRETIGTFVNQVLTIYDRVSKELLPTPRKSHYTFNLRDIYKVFQGFCTVYNAKMLDKITMVRLWYHQLLRVFHDRLINDEDRQYFKELLEQSFPRFAVKKEQVLNLQRIIFCDFWAGRELQTRYYVQIPDFKMLFQKILEIQDEYNNDHRFSGTGGKKAIRLVYFLDACEHICRISRIMRLPLGHALLLGVGGSGRQSLAKMATFISNYALFQIEVIKGYSIRSWREDLRKCLMEAALKNKPTSFIFVDTQIINEQMVEDINGVLNSGDVTGLYQQKEIDEITEECKPDCLRDRIIPNKMNVFSKYLTRVKNNLHLAIAMSPLGQVFSTRIRMFPSLINCCTINWFTEWPEEALVAVGKGQLGDFLLEQNDYDGLSQMVEVFKTMHKSVEQMSLLYRQELRRFNYVTPTSYLELLTVFKSVLKEKKLELKKSINRFRNGLNKLIDANTQVNQMQIKLKELQPQLQAKSIETESLIKVIQVQKKDAEETQKTVSEEQLEATQQKNEAEQIEHKVQESVAEADAELKKSLEAVDKLKGTHLVELKSSLGSPTKAMIPVIAGVCILMQDIIVNELGGKIEMQRANDSLKKEENYPETMRIHLLADLKLLLNLLKNFKKEEINQSLIAKFKRKVLSDPEFNQKKAYAASLPIGVLYLWCEAMYKFNEIYLRTQPERDKLAAVRHLVNEKTLILNEKKSKLAEIMAKLQRLQNEYHAKINLKEELTANIAGCEVKLERAKKLTSGLIDEKDRWSQEIKMLESLQNFIIGNSIVSAGMIAYSGPFTAHYRLQLVSRWKKRLGEIGILFQEQTTLMKFMGKPVQIQQWNIAGLPKDENSIQNGIIIQKSRRWPLMIDPQNQANKYIKNMGKEHHEEGIECLKFNNKDVIKSLEACIQQGKWALIENVGTELDPSIEPILLQQVVKTSSGLVLSLGEKQLMYNNHFKFFMTTTLPNPHYPPEIFVKVTVINFAITEQGLEDQMLAELVALENPQLEQKKKEIVKRNAEDKNLLSNIEDEILSSLNTEGGIEQLLQDETLINQLQNSKRTAAEINQRMKDSKLTEEQIDKAREGYRSVAYRSSLLFFCIVDLAGVDPMYQYSLQWFISLFKSGVENAAAHKELQFRLVNLNDYFTNSLYENVCRSLFQKHKLLFSFLLTAKILFGGKELDPLEWRFLLAGPTGDMKIAPNPTTFVSENSWPDTYRQLLGMDELPAFKGICEHFMTRPQEYQQIFDSLKPNEEELPAPWNSRLSTFQKIIVLKAIRSDKVIPAIENWISNKLGKDFIVPPPFELSKCYKDSSVVTPLIFVLSTGSDPVSYFLKFAQEMDGKKHDLISLGQGQGSKAEKMIKEASQRGGWVLLQNCHLAKSWMGDLQRIVEQLNQNLHKDFRLWLTSMPTPDFPISVLQNGVKVTVQPPEGIRSNLLRSYNNITSQQFNDCKQEVSYKKLLFNFCFFHAVIQNRRKFGPIGWNIPYEFTNEDLAVCKRQLRMLLDEYDFVPYKVLNYLGAEINYGGRVTDDKDVRLIKTILRGYVCPDALKNDYKFSSSGIYFSPIALELTEYTDYIESLPNSSSPEIFGLHENAEITNSQNQTINLLNSILSVQPRTSSKAGASREDIIEGIVAMVESKTPSPFDLEAIIEAYPTDYNESMNTVLVQEVIRYNRLLVTMIEHIASLKKALKGLVVLSVQLQQIGNQLFDNKVPKAWADKGFLSLKPLASWNYDLKERIDFLTSWIKNGTPKVFWIPGFFFPQGFITGSLQNYARKKVIAIDRISFTFQIIDRVSYKDVKQKPESGCYVYGIYIEGCRWDSKEGCLLDSKPKELFSDMPMLHIKPIEDRSGQPSNIYNCPLYKVVSRSGTLSTTGHSTNFVMYLELPSKVPQDKWIKAGVATFLSLRY